MDPDAAIVTINTAARDLDWEQVREAASGLLEWLRRGGFKPTTALDVDACDDGHGQQMGDLIHEIGWSSKEIPAREYGTLRGDLAALVIMANYELNDEQEVE